MSLYTLTSTTALPPVQIPEGLHFEASTNIELLAALGSITQKEVIRRFAHDNIACVAYLDTIPAAFGWMARGKALIGELSHEMILPVGNRYLWNFRTLEYFRGLNIYP